MTPPPARHHARHAYAIAATAALMMAMTLWLGVGCATPSRATQNVAVDAASVLTMEAYDRLVGELASPDMEGRGPGTAGLNKARDLIKHRFHAAGLSPGVKVIWGRPGSEGWGFTQAFDIDSGTPAKKTATGEQPKATVHNIIGVVPGAGDLARQIVVVGAHYDHLGYGEVGSRAPFELHGTSIHYGADDNASGTAGLILLAELYAQRATHSHTAARRTLMFVAFSGEERGLLGSSHLLRHLDDLSITTDRIVAMLNMDMIGRLTDNRLFILGTSSGDRWASTLRTAAAHSDLNLVIDNGYAAASDHLSFQLQRIPAIGLFTGVHADYHRPTDTADKVNTAGALRVLRLADSVIELLTTQRQRIAYAGAASGSHGGIAPLGHGAFLGIVPDHQSLHANDGVLITGTVPGSPADVAGLKPADRITHWNAQPLYNIYTLTPLLTAAKPGDTITLTINRNNATLTLKATLTQQ